MRRGVPAFARLRITSVRRVGLYELDDRCAGRDGMRTAAELRAVLKAIYPGARRFSEIRFRLIR